MANDAMLTHITGKDGFFAALDQSGGSTPAALRAYGVADTDYASEDEMFARAHEMRVRIMTSPMFEQPKVIASILFERTMESEIEHGPVPAFLWKERGIVPFLKVDQGLNRERDGVALMKPIAGLDALLTRATKLGMFGTKTRSLITSSSQAGITAVVAQQFAVASCIARHNLVPIVEPEISVATSNKAGAESLLLAELVRQLDALPKEVKVILKLTIPEIPNLYLPLVSHDRVIRILALSGGYARDEACTRLASNRGIIASFSRALVEGLTRTMNDGQFDAMLAQSINEIYRASVVKDRLV